LSKDVSATMRFLVAILVSVVVALGAAGQTPQSSPDLRGTLTQEVLLVSPKGKGQGPCPTRQKVYWKYDNQVICQLSFDKYDEEKQLATFTIEMKGMEQVCLGEDAVKESGKGRRDQSRTVTRIDGKEIIWKELILARKSGVDKERKDFDVRKMRQIKFFVSDVEWSKYACTLLDSKGGVAHIQIVAPAPSLHSRLYVGVPDPKWDALGMISFALEGKIWEGSYFVWPKCGDITSVPLDSEATVLVK
jgi:hypothetical protein